MQRFKEQEVRKINVNGRRRWQARVAYHRTPAGDSFWGVA